MKKKKSIIIGSIGVIGIVAIIIVKGYNDNEITKEDLVIEKNYGVAYTTSEITIDKERKIEEVSSDIEEAIPEKEKLKTNLTEAGYQIEEYETSLDNKTEAMRIYAKKDNHYIDISYCMNEQQAKTLFDVYEKQYSDFYLMAQNMNYVYCVSDKKTFEKAGFNSLANNGIQYINHNKK